MNRVIKARERVRAAEKELEAAMVAMFSPGTRTHYMLGKHRIECVVIQVSGDRVRVDNLRGKFYWLGGGRLAEAGGGE